MAAGWLAGWWQLCLQLGQTRPGSSLGNRVKGPWGLLHILGVGLREARLVGCGWESAECLTQ